MFALFVLLRTFRYSAESKLSDLRDSAKSNLSDLHDSTESELSVLQDSAESKLSALQTALSQIWVISRDSAESMQTIAGHSS